MANPVHSSVSSYDSLPLVPGAPSAELSGRMVSPIRTSAAPLLGLSSTPPAKEAVSSPPVGFKRKRDRTDSDFSDAGIDRTAPAPTYDATARPTVARPSPKAAGGFVEDDSGGCKMSTRRRVDSLDSRVDARVSALCRRIVFPLGASSHTTTPRVAPRLPRGSSLLPLALLSTAPSAPASTLPAALVSSGVGSGT